MRLLIIIVLTLLVGVAAGATAATVEPTSKSWLQKFLGVDAPETRIEKASNAVDLFQKMMVAATDSLATNNRTAELTPMARKDLDAHPDQVFVVEVYVPATDTGAEHILKREDFTVYGLGEDVYDALWKNNPVKTGVRNRAIDYSRSYFLIAVMVDGVLQWRMVPRPSPWVLKEKVDAAKARATKQTVAVSNVKVSEAPALPVETAVHTAPETVIIPRLNSIPDLNPSPEISESDRTDRLNVREIETPVAAPVTETTEKAEEQPPLEAGKSIFNYPRSDTTSPRSIPSVPVGGELQSTSDGDDSSTKGNNVPEPKSDGNDNSDNGSHTLPADLGSGMWKAFSQSIGCCDWEKFDVKPDECRIDPGKKPKKTRSGNVIVVLRCGPREE